MTTDIEQTESRVVVITGGNRGIGQELARQCAERGEKVVIACRDEKAGFKAASEMKGNVLVEELDVSNQDSIDAFVSSLAREVDQVDVLINNAAIAYDAGETSADTDFEMLHDAWETNVVGPWRLSSALLPMLKRSEHPRIVNVSSQAGSLATMTGGTPVYSITKAALNALTRTMAGDLQDSGVLVNAVCPGWTATDMGGQGGRPVEDGAASVLWAADLDDDGPTSTFTRDGQAIPW